MVTFFIFVALACGLGSRNFVKGDCFPAALFQFDGPAGPKWRSWNEDMKNAIVKNQNVASSGCRNGSWEPADAWSRGGGRVYATATNAPTLEVYYRYSNVFGGGK